MKLAIYFALFGLSLATSVEDQNEVNAPATNVQAKARSRRDAACGSTPTLLTTAQAQEMVSALNLIRSTTPATDMLALSWSDELAALAQAWANQCRWEYGMLYDCASNRMGQTMFVESRSDRYPVLNMTNVALQEQSLASNWNFVTARCNSGKDCGEFTQVVWSRSDKVGCAYALCPRITVQGMIWPNAVLVVCDYSPPGVVEDINGNLLPAYINGRACSSCDPEGTGAGYKCNNNLCEPCTPSSDPTCRCGNPSQVCRNNGVWSNATCSCQCSNQFFGTWCELPCSCDDQMPRDCPGWKAQGYCADGAYRTFLLTNCRKTCNFLCARPSTCSSTGGSN